MKPKLNLDLNRFKPEDDFDYSAMRETWKKAMADICVGLVGIAFLLLLIFIICLTRQPQ